MRRAFVPVYECTCILATRVCASGPGMGVERAWEWGEREEWKERKEREEGRDLEESWEGGEGREERGHQPVDRACLSEPVRA